MSRVKKRFWLIDEKREICRQAATAGFYVAQVARRYAVNANLIQNWMKDPRFALPTEDVTYPSEEAFLPVEVELSAQVLDGTLTAPSASGLCATRVDLTLSDGRRVLIEGPTALSAIVSLVVNVKNRRISNFCGLVAKLCSVAVFVNRYRTHRQIFPKGFLVSFRDRLFVTRNLNRGLHSISAHQTLYTSDKRKYQKRHEHKPDTS